MSLNVDKPYDRNRIKDKNAQLICSYLIRSLQIYLPDHIGGIIANMITPFSK